MIKYFHLCISPIIRQAHFGHLNPISSSPFSARGNKKLQAKHSRSWQSLEEFGTIQAASVKAMPKGSLSPPA